MLLKNLIKLPEKKEIVRNSFDNSVKNGCDTGYNQAIEIIGNLEIELDVDKIIKAMWGLHKVKDKKFTKAMEKSMSLLDLTEEREIAQAIADNFKEIIK